MKIIRAFGIAVYLLVGFAVTGAIIVYVGDTISAMQDQQ